MKYIYSKATAEKTILKKETVQIQTETVSASAFKVLTGLLIFSLIISALMLTGLRDGASRENRNHPGISCCGSVVSNLPASPAGDAEPQRSFCSFRNHGERLAPRNSLRRQCKFVPEEICFFAADFPLISGNRCPAFCFQNSNCRIQEHPASLFVRAGPQIC